MFTKVNYPAGAGGPDADAQVPIGGPRQDALYAQAHPRPSNTSRACTAFPFLIFLVFLLQTFGLFKTESLL